MAMTAMMSAYSTRPWPSSSRRNASISRVPLSCRSRMSACPSGEVRTTRKVVPPPFGLPIFCLLQGNSQPFGLSTWCLCRLTGSNLIRFGHLSKERKQRRPEEDREQGRQHAEREREEHQHGQSPRLRLSAPTIRRAQEIGLRHQHVREGRSKTRRGRDERGNARFGRPGCGECRESLTAAATEHDRRHPPLGGQGVALVFQGETPANE